MPYLPGPGKSTSTLKLKGYGNMLTYYDHKLGRERVKRRYTWAGWSFCGGIVLGMIVAHVL